MRLHGIAGGRPRQAAAAVGLTLTACTGDIAEEEAADVDCGHYEAYGTFDGAEVTVRHHPRPRG